MSSFCINSCSLGERGPKRDFKLKSRKVVHCLVTFLTASLPSQFWTGVQVHIWAKDLDLGCTGAQDTSICMYCEKACMCGVCASFITPVRLKLTSTSTSFRALSDSQTPTLQPPTNTHTHTHIYLHTFWSYEWKNGLNWLICLSQRQVLLQLKVSTHKDIIKL